MTAGLTIFNAGGTVQIDENWRNYGYRGKIIQNITVTPSTGPVDTSVSIGGEAVLLACRAQTLLPQPMNSYFDGTTWEFRWRFFGQFIDEGYVEDVEFYVFDVLPGGGFSNVGLEVFDAAGARVFHSDMSPMRVPEGGVLPAATSFSGESGRIYAPLILRNPIFSELYPFPSGYRHSTYTLRCAGSSIVSEYRAIGTGSLGAFGSDGRYAAVDVTGLS